MPTLVGFSTFAALPEEQITEKISRRICLATKRCLYGGASRLEFMWSRTATRTSRSCGWSKAKKMEFRLGSEQRVCGPGDVVVISGGTEHEAWFREDTEVIDFFAPPREDFRRGGKLDYMNEG